MFNIFRDLFRPKKPDLIPASTAVETAPIREELLQQAPQVVTRDPVKIRPPQLVVGIAQSTGRQRDHNEDTLYAMHTILADGDTDLPFGIFLVADGMGGHLNGEVASRSAARAFPDYVLKSFYLPLLTGSANTGEMDSIHEIMEKGVVEAQRAVLRTAPGGGTTLTAAMVIGDQVTLAHVGDSRAYFLHEGGRIEVITQDHSLVRRLQDLGQIDEKEASVHPQRNVLYRALGQSEPFRPDLKTIEMPASGYFLICSDGLWGSVPDDDIYSIVQNAPNLMIAAHNLIEAANMAGGPDNISAILVQYQN